MRKRIVVCVDGTWNRPERDPEDIATNVLRLARAVQPIADDGMPQQVFYDWGIGSFHDKVVAGATGSGLHKNVMDGYRYIVQNYEPEDEIYLFGFSRGAYTVRSLCGLINNVGILRRPDAKLIQAAFDHYKRPGGKHAPDGPASLAFRKAHSHEHMCYSHEDKENCPDEERIKFVGVWDTVGAMGIPIRFLGFLESKDEFYDAKIGPNVAIARHALAIDELRGDFEPTVWLPRKHLDIKQVWFAGAHSDVGGGYKRGQDGTLLSDIPLKWMMSEAIAAGLTIETHLGRSIKSSPTAKLHRSRRKFYRLKKPFHRTIDHGKGETVIHRSVRQRWERDPKYRPKNLVEYKRDKGWGTLVG